jgi:putative transposase
MAHKVYRFRIYPTKRQTQTLNNQLAICAELYNAGLQERRDAWKLSGKSISYFDQTLQLAQVKPIRDDVAAISANVLENVLKRVDLAFNAFFRRVKAGQKAGYPRFKSFRRYDSMTFRQIGNAITKNKLRVSKIGQVRIKLHRPIQGTIKTLTIKRDAGRWLAIFACEVESNPLPFNPNVIGVDVGLTHFATLSNGSTIENPRYYRTGQAALRIAQRRFSRRRKGSNRQRKAVLAAQRAHAHVQAQRRDFLHKTSRSLVSNFGLIAVENLNVKGMARNHNLAKSIHDAGWSTFIDMLTYKAEDAGRVLVKVDPRGTSQTCTCGAEVRKTLADRWHLCLSCGLSAARDHVSAQVILGRAVRLQDLTGPVAASVS